SLRFYNFAIPVLVGIPLPKALQLVLSARVHDYAYYVGAGSVGGLINNFGVGLGAGVAVRLWRLVLLPELGLLQPIVVTATRSDMLSGAQVRPYQTTLQLNLSVLWGNGA